MAPWIAHIRIAANLLPYLTLADKFMFLFGNVAPDSGLPIPDSFEYDPPKAVTHWRAGKAWRYEDFWTQYVAAEDLATARGGFMLGYYLHLRTDECWSVNVWRLAKARFGITASTMPEVTPAFINHVKNEWYYQDHVYLRTHPDNIYTREMVHARATIPDYLDYFPRGAFTERWRGIREFYATPFELGRTPDYFLTEDMDRFVEETTATMLEILREKGVYPA